MLDQREGEGEAVWYGWAKFRRILWAMELEFLGNEELGEDFQPERAMIRSMFLKASSVG